MTTKEMQQLVKIAQENILALENRENLESQNSGDADFFEASVWDIKAALVAAYELGKKSK